MTEYEKTGKKRSLSKLFTLLLMTVCCLCFSAASVQAAKEGFVQKSGNVYYRTASGEYAKGWMKINKKIYFFDRTTGIMVTGWRINNSTGQKRFFHEKGYMVTGWTKSLRYFDPSTGYMSTGWKEINGKRYFFHPNTGYAYTGWVKNPQGYLRFFNEDGSMKTGWSSTLRYFDQKTGIMVTGWKKVDRHKYYFQDTNGKATTGWMERKGKKYYFNENGSMQTGWTLIDSYWYFFEEKSGYMLTDTVQDGVKIKSNGKASPNKKQKKTLIELSHRAKILILSGHGMGDSGACSTIGNTEYEEYRLTREFAKLIYGFLTRTKLDVTLYDQRYDLFQILTKQKNGPVPVLTDYDYVLEVHFNAMEHPDLRGNGSYMGCGMMINSAKKDYQIDRNIIRALAKTGFAIWGREDGIFTSSGLVNARTCQSKGVSYGLLETAFIDDKDDMTFYLTHKKIMAKAVSDAIESYFIS